MISHDITGPQRWADQKERGFYNAPFYVAKKRLNFDAATSRWIRNIQDENAAMEGMKFSEHMGCRAVEWISSNCYLYEGEKQGQLMDLEDWQFEFFMQVYGWQKYNPDRGRWVRRFRTADVFIPKKNCKSPTLAANSCYLLIGDGELGQKVYNAAGDGKQALISHLHMENMIKQNKELYRKGVIKINGTTHEISYEPTKSVAKLVCSGTKTEGTEGFNGSVSIDEIHVVSFELMERLKYAGASRAQPLQTSMSTFGSNVEGYGFARYEYCKQLQNGELHNLQAYTMLFCDDPDRKMEDYYDRPTVEKIIVRTNPTLGRVLDRSEILSAYDEAVPDLSNLMSFLMYRVNKWVAGSEVWLSASHWAQCNQRLKLKDLLQFPCVGGIDLSKTKDTTAFSSIFGVPINKFCELFGFNYDGKLYRNANQLPQTVLSSLPRDYDENPILPTTYTWSWIPEETARQYSKNVNYKSWESKGYITICPGHAIDYEYLCKRIEWLRANTDLRLVGCDPYNTDRVVQIMMDTYGWGENELVAVKQTMPFMAPPSGEFERLHLRHEIAHNGNPLLAWQVGHCEAKTDIYGNKRPIKPDPNSFRKIDGVVSLVIALAMFYTHEAGIVTGGLPSIEGFGNDT